MAVAILVAVRVPGWGVRGVVLIGGAVTVVVDAVANLTRVWVCGRGGVVAVGVVGDKTLGC